MAEETGLQSIERDDDYFALRLDYIPKKYLVTLTDEEKDLRFERQHAKKKPADEVEEDHQNKKHKRNYSEIKSNAEFVEQITRKHEEHDKQVAKDLLKNENVKLKKRKIDDATLADLRKRLAEKVTREKREQPKLPAPSTKRAKRTEENGSNHMSEEEGGNKKKRAGKDQSKMNKQELEIKLSYGTLNTQDPNTTSNQALKSTDEGKPQAKPTSTKSVLNVKKLIKNAEESQRRLEQLKEEGEHEQVTNEKWDVLERKAQGEKVRDDPKLLKKTLKRLEHKKKKTKQQWAERKDKLQEEKKEREETKQKNIAERRSGGSTTTKEKRTRPGFEGSRSSSSSTSKPAESHSKPTKSKKESTSGKKKSG